jgi:hypothetical protein
LKGFNAAKLEYCEIGKIQFSVFLLPTLEFSAETDSHIPKTSPSCVLLNTWQKKLSDFKLSAFDCDHSVFCTLSDLSVFNVE